MNLGIAHAAFGLVVLVGCAPAWPAKGRMAARHTGLEPGAVEPRELAAWLNDPKAVLARPAAEPGPPDEKVVADPPAAPDPEPLMTRATAALERGDLAEARALAMAVIALDPTGYPYAYVVLGDVALAERSLASALERYRRALELDPDDGWAAQRIAQVLTLLGRALEARLLLRRFTAEHPDADPDAWDALAWLELELGDAPRAEAAFRKALEQSDGDDAEAWYGLAMIHARRGDALAVEKDLRALFALQPRRRLVIERDPTFFRLRIHPNVAALFSPQRLAEARAEAPPVAAGPERPILAVPGGVATALADTVRFDFDSARPRPDSSLVLDQVAAFLVAQKNLEFVRVIGHADRRGDEAYNIQLSVHRAEAVRAALVARGVSAKLLSTKGYGVYCPLDDGDDESAFAKNRRVEFAIGAGGKVFGEELSCLDRMKRWLTPTAEAQQKP